MRLLERLVLCTKFVPCFFQFFYSFLFVTWETFAFLFFFFLIAAFDLFLEFSREGILLSFVSQNKVNTDM